MRGTVVTIRGSIGGRFPERFSGVAGHSARHLLDPRGTYVLGDGIIMGADADGNGTLLIATSKPSEGLGAMA
jgi:hypothetical protein